MVSRDRILFAMMQRTAKRTLSGKPHDASGRVAGRVDEVIV